MTDRSASRSAEQLEQKVGLIREHLTDVVSELDYRRHELMDVKGQLKKHSGLIAGVVGGALFIAGTLVTVSLWRKRYAKKVKTRVVTLEGKPYESVAHRIATAAAGALVAVAMKSIAQAVVQPMLEAGRAPAGELPALPD